MLEKDKQPQNGEQEQLPCSCDVRTDVLVHTRRCFMTGEYCSKLSSIQKDRKAIYNLTDSNQAGKVVNQEDGSKGNMVDGSGVDKSANIEDDSKAITINAFVIMNFSDMSGVVYQWRIEPFIKSLNKYLTYDTERNVLICNKKPIERLEKSQRKIRIRVTRADTDPASNYVICNRICQQLQTADLVIVDVSSQNPNVFYEFGMAVALGKLILPICYSGSFFKMSRPFNNEEEKKQFELDEDRVNKLKERRLELERHIGCYPWRRVLFENYGIRYKDSRDQSDIRYLDYEKATAAANNFEHIKYDQFPYSTDICGKQIDEELRKYIESAPKGREKDYRKKETDSQGNCTGELKIKVGEAIYTKLTNAYNDKDSSYNTLVVYTMERFLNEDDAGLCMINFYNFITKQMVVEKCFCGERVAVLVQEHPIPESDKDTKEQLNLFYNTGEIIHIGVNEATYQTEERKVRVSKDKKGGTGGNDEEAERYAREHIRNRGMIVYPDNPVYVERLKHGTTGNLLETPTTGFFCLYHVMLRTLRYAYQLVVDISDNSLQALFWLGTAHGSDIKAITVLHEYTDKERSLLESTAIRKSRNVFDVAGLWTAYYYSADTKGFYEQLFLAQMGIERHSGLMLSETVLSMFAEQHNKRNDINIMPDLVESEQAKEALESYYRKRFWAPMLYFNRFHIYLKQYDDNVVLGNNGGRQNEEEHQGREGNFISMRARIAKWDFEVVSEISDYLSKRAAIGEYRVISCTNNKQDKNHGEEASDDKQNDKTKKSKEDYNYICIGGDYSVSDELYKRIVDVIGSEKAGNDAHGNVLRVRCIDEQRQKERCVDHVIFRTIPEIDEELDIRDGFDGTGNKTIHKQIAQLILWRDDLNDDLRQSRYRVALNGSSGPATYALSAVLVNDDHRLKDKRRQKYYLLYNLQGQIRVKFLDLYFKRLAASINQIDLINRKDIAAHVKKILSYYFDQVLYRYFFPFLSRRDRERICNELRIYLYTLYTSKLPPFDVLKAPDIIKSIIEVLEDVLNDFTGIEAFFVVDVSIQGGQKNVVDYHMDNREVISIDLLDECKNSSIRKVDGAKPSTDTMAGKSKEVNLLIATKKA